MRKALLVSVLTVFLVENARADIGFELPKTAETTAGSGKVPLGTKLDGQTVHIYCYGAVADMQVVELPQALDEINNKYPKSSAVNFFITRDDREWSSGWATYWAIKSSAILMNAFRVGFVASLTSAIYCARSGKSAFYWPEPAQYVVPQSLKPDIVMRLERCFDKVSETMAAIYADCSSLSPQEMADKVKENHAAKSCSADNTTQLLCRCKRQKKIHLLRLLVLFFINEKCPAHEKGTE